MWRFAPVFVLLCALASAHATGYDEFSRGLSASNRHDDDLALSLFSSALAAGDLNANLQPVAHLERGRVYLRKEDCGQALADFSAALVLKPGYLEALMGRAEANICLKNLAAAVSDLSAAIERTPAPPLYFARARARYFLRDFTGASDDLERAMKLEPEFPYFAIWLGLAQLRAGLFEPNRFAHTVSQIDSRSWPYPILSLLEGEETGESVIRVATRDGAKGERCEADFYVAEWDLISQKPEAARPLLQEAVSICPHGYVELQGARIELARLRKAP